MMRNRTIQKVMLESGLGRRCVVCGVWYVVCGVWCLISKSIRESRVSNRQALVVIAERERETVCARKQGIWQSSTQLKRGKVVEGHEIQVEVRFHELNFRKR